MPAENVAGEWTAEHNEAVHKTHRPECRERRPRENGARVPHGRDSRRHGEKPDRRDGSTSFADRSVSASETCRRCRLIIRTKPRGSDDCEHNEERRPEDAHPEAEEEQQFCQGDHVT